MLTIINHYYIIVLLKKEPKWKFFLQKGIPNIRFLDNYTFQKMGNIIDCGDMQ